MNSDVAYAMGQRLALQHIAKRAGVEGMNKQAAPWDWGRAFRTALPGLALGSPLLYGVHQAAKNLYGQGGPLASPASAAAGTAGAKAGTKGTAETAAAGTDAATEKKPFSPEQMEWLKQEYGGAGGAGGAGRDWWSSTDWKPGQNPYTPLQRQMYSRMGIDPRMMTARSAAMGDFLGGMNIRNMQRQQIANLARQAFAV